MVEQARVGDKLLVGRDVEMALGLNLVLHDHHGVALDWRGKPAWSQQSLLIYFMTNLKSCKCGGSIRGRITWGWRNWCQESAPLRDKGCA